MTIRGWRNRCGLVLLEGCPTPEKVVQEPPSTKRLTIGIFTVMSGSYVG